MAISEQLFNANFKGLFDRLEHLNRTTDDIKNLLQTLVQIQKAQSQMLEELLRRDPPSGRTDTE